MKIKMNTRVLLGMAMVCLSGHLLASSSSPEAEFVKLSSWGKDRYCGEIHVTSPGYEITDWRVQGTVTGTIKSVWNGSAEKVAAQDHNVVFRPSDWNNTIPTGGTATIGLCGSGGTPTDLAVRWRGESEPEVLEITDLASGYYNDHVTEKQYIVANTAAELEAVENMVGQELDVDIDSHTVLAAFMGTRSTGGYDIQITQAVATATSVDTQVVLTSPGPNCMVTQALTSPYHVVAIPKTAKDVNFIENHHVTDCGR